MTVTTCAVEVPRDDVTVPTNLLIRPIRQQLSLALDGLESVSGNSCSRESLNPEGSRTWCQNPPSDTPCTTKKQILESQLTKDEASALAPITKPLIPVQKPHPPLLSTNFYILVMPPPAWWGGFQWILSAVSVSSWGRSSLFGFSTHKSWRNFFSATGNFIRSSIPHHPRSFHLSISLLPHPPSNFISVWHSPKDIIFFSSWFLTLHNKLHYGFPKNCACG